MIDERLTAALNAVNQAMDDLRGEDPAVYVTNREMVEYVRTTVDTWAKLLEHIILQVTARVDGINGEIVMNNLCEKVDYLAETKRLIKEKIQQFNPMPEDTVFREYPDYITGGGPTPPCPPQHMHVFQIQGVDRTAIPYAVSMIVVPAEE